MTTREAFAQAEAQIIKLQGVAQSLALIKVIGSYPWYVHRHGSNLLAYYRMGESSDTTLYDVSIYRNHATTVGSPTLGQSGAVFGDSDTSVEFSGSTQRAATASTTFAYANNVTIEAWVYPTAASYSTSNRDTIWGASDASQQISLELGGTAGTNRFAAIINGVLLADTNDNAIILNQWNHIVYTRTGTGTTHKIYVNGAQQTLVTNVNSGSYTDAASVKLIGARTASTQFFQGKIDEVAVYKVALTPAEVLEHYTLGIAGAWQQYAQAGAEITGVYVSHSFVRALYSVTNTPVHVSESFIRVVYTIKAPALAQAQALIIPTQPYRDAVTADSPDGYWPLSDNDQLVRSYVGSNGWSYGSSYVALGGWTRAVNVSMPAYDRAQGISNNNTAAMISTWVSQVTNNFTVEAWVKPGKAIGSGGTLPTESTSGTYTGYNSNVMSFVYWPTHMSSNRGLGLSVGTNGVVVAAHGSSTLCAILSYSVTLSGWHHVAVVVTNKQPVLYLDGVAVKTGLTISQTLYSPTNIGDSGSNYGYISGSLSNAALYSSTLTAEQILNHYNNGVPRVYAQALAHIGKQAGYAQAAAIIESKFGLVGVGQAEARIYSFDVPVFAQAQAHMFTSPTQYAQVQARVFLEYASEILNHKSNLLAYWRMDDTDTTIKELVSGLDATTNNVTFGVSGALQGDPTSTATQFSNASDSYGYTASNTFTFNNVLTIEAWVYPTASARQTIYGCNNVANQPQLEISGVEQVSVIIDNTYIAETNNYAVTLNAWNHIVYTRSGTGAGTHKIYINGVSQALVTDSASNFADAASVKTIGVRNYSSSSQTFNGKIDELAIYNTALSAGDVLLHYALGMGMDYVETVWADKPYEWIPANEDSGTVAAALIGLLGTYTTSPAWTYATYAPYPTNVFDKAITGGGSTSLSVSISGITQYTNNLALEAWVKPNATITLGTESTSGTGAGTGYQSQSYIWAPYQMGGNRGIGLSVGTNGITIVAHGDGNIYCLATYTGTISSSQMNHVVGVINNKQALIYLNGELVRTGLTDTLTLYAPTSISSDGTNGSYGPLNGTANHFALYNYVLSATQIQNHYTVGITDFSNRGFAQAQATIIKSQAWAQAQTYIIGTYNKFAQVQAFITRHQQHAQVQAKIIFTQINISQAQASILLLVNQYAQAEVSIDSNITLVFQHAQAEAFILILQNVFAQAAAQLARYVNTSLAQAVIIPRTGLLAYLFFQGSGYDHEVGTIENIYSISAPNMIKYDDGSNKPPGAGSRTSYFGVTAIGRFVADETGAWYFHLQSDDASRISIYNSANEIVGTVGGWPSGAGTWTGTINLTQGQEYKIIWQWSEGGGNAYVTYNHFKRPSEASESWLTDSNPAPWILEGTRYRWANAGAFVTRFQSHALANADILTLYNKYAQAQAYMVKDRINSFAQAEATIFSPKFANAQARIKQVYQPYSQAQVSVTKYSKLNGHGLSRALIKGVPRQFAYVMASINDRKPHANVLAYIKRGEWVVANVQGKVIKPWKKIAHVQASVIVYDQNAYAQVMTTINQMQFTAQSVAKVIGYDYNRFGMAQAWIMKGTQFALAQARMYGEIYQVYAQAKTQIEKFIYASGQARTRVKRQYRMYAQADASIKSISNSVFTTPMAFIKQKETYSKSGQAGAFIGTLKIAQAQAKIHDPRGYANAMAYVPMYKYVVKYNNYDLPGYAQFESYINSANLIQYSSPYNDNLLEENRSIENKIISLKLKVVGETLQEVKEQTQKAATVLRSNRENTYKKLYIGQLENYYLVKPTSITFETTVQTSKLLEYNVEFIAKPWLFGETVFTLSGSTSIDTGSRDLSDGTWTPATILLTGTNITVSGYTQGGDFTGFISVSGSVSNLLINPEDYTATINGVNKNNLMKNLDYIIYVGPGKTYFTITGATSAIISYRNRWNI